MEQLKEILDFLVEEEQTHQEIRNLEESISKAKKKINSLAADLTIRRSSLPFDEIKNRLLNRNFIIYEEYQTQFKRFYEENDKLIMEQITVPTEKLFSNPKDKSVIFNKRHIVITGYLSEFSNYMDADVEATREEYRDSINSILDSFKDKLGVELLKKEKNEKLV